MLSLITATFGSLNIEAGTDEHPNKLKFKGVLLQLDQPSTKPPNGAKGHRILVPKEVAAKRLKTLIGMGVNLSNDQDGHAPQRKVGVIKKAWIDGSELWISGTVWKKDFPDAKDALESKKLGMSFEGSEVQIEDQSAHIWKVKDLVFTGAALLLKTAAAYLKTEALAASAMYAELVGISNGGVVMAKTNKVEVSPELQQVANLLATAMAPLAEAVTAQTAAITSLHASMESNQADVLEMFAAKKSKKSEDDDEDDDEEEDDEDEDEDEDVDAKKVKAGKEKKDEEDEEVEAEEEEVKACSCGGKGCSKCGKMKAAKSEQGDNDLEELEEVEDAAKPGKMNKEAAKNKGNKTTVTTHASAAKLRKLVFKLMASNDELVEANAKLRKQLKKQEADVEAAAERVSRKSVQTSKVHLSAAASNAMKPSALFTGLLSKYELSASDGSKKTMAEFNAVLDAAGITDVTQRIALKTEAERNGTVYTTEEMLAQK